MAIAPPLTVGNPHMIAQHIPHDTWLHAGRQRLDDRHRPQTIQILVTRYAPAVGPAEDLINQLPKLPFPHMRRIYSLPSTARTRSATIISMSERCTPSACVMDTSNSELASFCPRSTSER